MERLFRTRYPRTRERETRAMFPKLFKRLKKTGQLKPQYESREGRRTVRICDLEVAVLNRVNQEPTISTRSVANEMGVAYSTVWILILEQQLHLYHHRKCILRLLLTSHLASLSFKWLLQCYTTILTFLRMYFPPMRPDFTEDGMLDSR